MRQNGWRSSIPAFALFFVSGLTGLVYQVVWLREFTLIFGATAYASSAILSTFMGGLALGSYWSGRRADRWQVAPLRTYGKLELGIAVYALLIPVLLARLTPLLGLAWRLGADRHFAVLGLLKFIAIAILILPATTLMGATLPVLSRVVTRSGRSAGAGVGALYAVNTFGAVAGTVACAFVALPAIGMRRTLIANVALNLLVGGVAWVLGGRKDETPPPIAETSDESPTSPTPPRMLVYVFAASGFAAMVLEVAWTRGLALVLGSSVYAYASMLVAFLFGLAMGAGSAAHFLARRRTADPRAVLAMVLAIAGVLSLLAAYAIQALPRVFAEIYLRFHPSPDGWWLAEVGLSLIVMFPATYALGWVFPLVLESVGGRRQTIAASVGRIYAANTLGTIVGAAAGGFVLIPTLGVGATVVAVAVVQLLLGAVLLPGATAGTPGRRRTLAAACVAAAGLCVLFRPEWDVLLMNSGVYLYVDDFEPNQGWKEFIAGENGNREVVYARDGLTTTVVVVRQRSSQSLYLTVNGKTDASSSGDLDTQILLGQIPLLVHPAPRDVLVIGLASGITLGTVATHPVEHIRVAEIEHAMIGAARLFGPYNHDVLDDPRVTVSVNDARNELVLNPASYDVIISEPSNPWMTVASNLFTEEFFAIGKTRLRPGGVFGQWIQNYCLTPADLKSILAGFHRAFPHVLVFGFREDSDLLVLGSDQPLTLDLDAIERRMENIWIHAEFVRIGVRDAVEIAAMLQTGGDAFSELVRGAEENTDDNGLIEFAAPKALFIDTQDDNITMLREALKDPMSPVAAVVRTAETPDALRLDMIRRWIRHGRKRRAALAVPFFADPAMRSLAEELLRTASPPALD